MSRYFKIGEITVSIQSDLQEVKDDFVHLYRDCCLDRPMSGPLIRMEVKQAGRSRLGKKRYSVFGDNKEIITHRRVQELLPYLEWGINWRVMQTRSEYLQIHAASMAYRGQGFVFTGPSGAGKSTLAAGLLARRWNYLCDEFALICPVTRKIHPFPKAICVKAGSFQVMKQLNLPLAGNQYYVKTYKGQVGYVRPADIDSRLIGDPSPIRFVILPRYAGHGTPRLNPISRAKAAFALAEQSLNRNAHGDRAMSILNAVVRGAACFELETGSIDDTGNLLESLIVSS